MALRITYRKRRSRDPSHENEAPGLPREFRISFGACYAYSPHGTSSTSEQSRLLRNRVKNGGVEWLNSYTARVSEQVRRQHRFSGLFTPNALLVPIPKYRSPQLWVARRLALGLERAGLGKSVWAGLLRVAPVSRSSSAWMWERPTVRQHFHSFATRPLERSPAEIILIDDIVTKGRTLVAGAMRLQQAFPQARIRAFALVRTMGLILDVERTLDPCEGEIRWDGEDARREP